MWVIHADSTVATSTCTMYYISFLYQHLDSLLAACTSYIGMDNSRFHYYRERNIPTFGNDDNLKYYG
jgi:hypothetical protein